MMIRSLLVATLIILGYSGVVAFFPANISRRGISTHQGNLVRVEGVLWRNPTIENIVVGSSLSDTMRSESLGPSFASLAFPGAGALTGLEILGRNKAAPRRVFIEANLLLKAPDSELISYGTEQPGSWIRRSLPVFLEGNSPISLLFSWIQSRRPRSPTLSNAALLAVGLNYYRRQFDATNAVESDSESLALAARRVAELQNRGTEVLFFELPVHPSLAETSRVRGIRKMITELFPESKYQWVPIPSDGSEQFTDGIHLTTASAARVAQSLREAGSGKK